MNNIIIASANHPLYSQLSKLDLPFYTINRSDDLFVIEDHQDATVYDFTLAATIDKDQLIDALVDRFSVVSDLSCAWGDMLHEKYPKLQASFAGSFYSPKFSLEVYTQGIDFKHVDSVMQKLGLKSVPVKQAGHGFIFPRTISMIINEAYFSLEDHLAQAEDMDTAMKFGVNYPLGPFEWAKNIGLTPIKLLLEDLHYFTQDERYKLSTKLRLQEQTQ